MQRRYAIQDSGGLRYFTWDTNGMNLLCERDAGGTVTRKYTHGPTPINGIGSTVEIEDAGASEYKYLHMDHRGTVFRTTDGGEANKDTYNWNAWGEVLHESETGFSQRFGYQSNWLRLTDGTDDLISLTRNYHAGVGRFLQQDHTDRHGRSRDYGYALGAPVSTVDPQGAQETGGSSSKEQCLMEDEHVQLGPLDTAWKKTMSRFELHLAIPLNTCCNNPHVVQVAETHILRWGIWTGGGLWMFFAGRRPHIDTGEPDSLYYEREEPNKEIVIGATHVIITTVDTPGLKGLLRFAADKISQHFTTCVVCFDKDEDRCGVPV